MLKIDLPVHIREEACSSNLKVQNQMNQIGIVDLITNLSDQIRLVPDELILPHPKTHLRNFVLYPIYQIDPKWSHPILKKNVGFLINKLSQKSRIEITRLKKNVNIQI